MFLFKTKDLQSNSQHIVKTKSMLSKGTQITHSEHVKKVLVKVFAKRGGELSNPTIH